MSAIAQIFISKARGSALESREEVEAIADVGLDGDRYQDAQNRKSPDYQLTLIESEWIEQFERDTGLSLLPAAPRRNLVTRGVRLNEFVGRQFTVGAALLEGLELCEPCRLSG